MICLWLGAAPIALWAGYNIAKHLEIGPYEV
jgi:hypothetical protein